MKTGLNLRIKYEHILFMLIVLFWLTDSVMDMLLFSTGQNRLPFANSHGMAIHITVFLVQLTVILFGWITLKKTNILKKSQGIIDDFAGGEQAKVHNILEAMDDPVSMQDTDFRILYQNEAHRKLMGSHPGEYCYQAYLGNKTICDGCHLEKTFVEGMAHRQEASLKTSSRQLHMEILSSPLRNPAGDIIAGIEVLRDITRRKNAEQKIRKLNEDLQRQANELTASYRELESFSYSVSHDLRTPLTRIYSAGQFLEEQYGELLDQNGRFFVRTICDAAEHMEELIQALMSLSHVASSDMNCEEVDIVPIARTIIADLQQNAPDRAVEFVYPAQLPVTGDRKLLEVLLENLIGNAWKYTGKRNQARIELGCSERGGRRVCFVRDNGAGFDMKKAGLLFRPFKRLHSTDDFPGTGVGLATVQRIVQRHGGEIWAEAKVDKGATFYFSI